MKKECEEVRRLLPRALRGHVFRSQERRVAAHVRDCVFCRSELEALRRAEETRLILQEVDPGAGASSGIASRLSWAVTLLFRPLWLVAVIAVVAAAYLYAVRPLLHDPDLERLDAAAPVPPRTLEPVLSSSPRPTRAAAIPDAAPGASAHVPSLDPLIVIITVDREAEKMGIRRINEAMKEHALLKAMRMSDSVREISGNLTVGELATFFARIQDVGKITYKRSRLASADSAMMLPFIMRLTVSSAAVRPPVPETTVIRSDEHRRERPGESSVGGQADAPADSAAGKPEGVHTPAAPLPQ